MTVDEVNAYARKYSKAYSSGPWKTEFDAMAKKTVLRRILKYGPMSTDMQNVETYEIQAAKAQAQADIDAYANSRVIDTTPVSRPPEQLPSSENIPFNAETGEVVDTGLAVPDRMGEDGGPEF